MTDLRGEIWSQVYIGLGFEETCDARRIFDLQPDPGYWFVPVLQGVTSNRIVRALRQAGVVLEVYFFGDGNLDRGVVADDRDPERDGGYSVGFSQTVEADPDHANCSADMLRDRKVKGITLRERLLLELAHHRATGSYLDTSHMTLCSGSGDRFGNVPYVYCNLPGRKVCVGHCEPAFSNPHLRCRGVRQVFEAGSF